MFPESKHCAFVMATNRLLVLPLLIPLACSVATLRASVYVPPGLNPGELYHLAFVTSGAMRGVSHEIAVYNQFVQEQAALNPSLTGTDMGVVWRAIASTPRVGAQDNAPVGVDVPVFLLDGTRIADGFAEMWDGAFDAPLNRDQFASLVLPNVWTAATDLGSVYSPYEMSPPSRGQFNGFTYSNYESWINSRSSIQFSEKFPLYALSQTLAVPSNEPFEATEGHVPEPLSAVIWLWLGGVLGLFGAYRRRSVESATR